MGTFENNEKKLESVLERGLGVLAQNFPVKKLDAGKFSRVITMNTPFNIAHYEIEGVGHLMTMQTEDNPKMQMITFTLTPYFKALPLLSFDYMFSDEGGMIISEVYELVENREDEKFRVWMNKYADKLKEFDDFQSIPAQPCFYDSIRPIYVQKMRNAEKDDLSIQNFADMLKIFADEEKATAKLSDAEFESQKNIQHKYVDDLIDENGFTTKMWVQEHGSEFVREYYHTVFFGV